MRLCVRTYTPPAELSAGLAAPCDAAHSSTPSAYRAQGNCESAPQSFPDLSGYRSPQCVIYVASSWLTAPANATTLWLDNLHLRSARTAPSDEDNYGIASFDAPRMDVWVSNATFQGDGGIGYGLGVANGTRGHVSGVRT